MIWSAITSSWPTPCEDYPNTEQRHLAGVMLGLENDPGLNKFLETTKAQLDEHYAKVGALLNRRYFTQ